MKPMFHNGLYAFLQCGCIGLLAGGAGFLFLRSDIFGPSTQINAGHLKKGGEIIVYIIFGISAGMIIGNMIYLQRSGTKKSRLT